MKNDDTYLSVAMLIKSAREEKDMTINDLAFAIDKENIKIYEKKIKLWESENDYPNLDEIYKLCSILELNPNELMIYRDRHRKTFVKTNTKKKYKKVDWDEVKETASILAITFGKLFIIFACILFAVVYCKLVVSAIGGDGGDQTSERMGNSVNYIMDSLNTENSNNNIIDDTGNLENNNENLS